MTILADLLPEEKVMRRNKAFVKNETVSKINLNKVFPLKNSTSTSTYLLPVVS